MAKLLVLAQNPKTKANIHSPLKDTKSWQVFNHWISLTSVDAGNLVIKNAYHDVGYKAFTLARIKKDVEAGIWDDLVRDYPVIVTLGTVAALAIKLTAKKLGIRGKYYYLPHPSGLNRKLNNADVARLAKVQLRTAYIVSQWYS